MSQSFHSSGRKLSRRRFVIAASTSGVVAAMCLSATKLFRPGVSLPTPAVVSADFRVFVNGMEQRVDWARTQDDPWTRARSGTDSGGRYSFTNVDVDGPAVVRVVSAVQSLAAAVIRPGTAGITDLLQSASEISFTIAGPIKVVIEPAGIQGPLFLFANPVNVAPDRSDPNVVWLGPGIHIPAGGVITVTSGKTLYLAAGAVLRGGVTVQGAGVTIRGRGIIDGSWYHWDSGAPNPINVASNSNGVTIEGVTIRGSSTWTIALRFSENITVTNVKIMGGRVWNDDGIDIINSANVAITDCCVRTDDDCIAVKGMSSAPVTNPVDTVTISGSLFWCNRARTVLIGDECMAPMFRNITMMDCDVLHFSPVGSNGLTIVAQDEVSVLNVLFADIRMHGDGNPRWLNVSTDVNQYGKRGMSGHVDGVTFRNVAVTGRAGTWPVTVSGNDPSHQVANVAFENVTRDGVVVTATSPGVTVGGNTANISFS